MANDRPEGKPLDAAEEARARDTHRSTTLLTLLVLLWGAVSLFVVPLEPFWIPNVTQVVVCAIALVYFLHEWKRPRLHVATVFASILIAYSLLLLPWTTVSWSHLGRPLEAFTVPEMAAISVALVFPGKLSVGLLVMILFAAESVFALAYARHIGLGHLVPITEPAASFAIVVLGIGLLALRQRRRHLVQQYIRVQADIQALDPLRPLFSDARDQLESEIHVLAADMCGGRRDPAPGFSPSVRRSIDRLGDLCGKLERLLENEEPLPVHEAERQLLAHNAHSGATTLAGIGLTIAIPTIAWSLKYVGGASPYLFLIMSVVNGAVLAYLLATRRRPSEERALRAGMTLFVAMLLIVSYNQALLVRLQRPYVPLLGHKLLMVAIGETTLTSKQSRGVTMILLTAVTALALWFGLNVDGRRDLVSVAEPWTTLVFMLIGLTSLRMLEQSRLASIELLRAEAKAAALQRSASMFLALRDQLNSPLQTLLLCATTPPPSFPTDRIEHVRAAVERLVALSGELRKRDWLQPSSQRASLDASRELGGRA